MGQAVKNESRICPLAPGPWKEVPRYMRSRTIMAVGLTFMLTTTGLAFYLILPNPIGGIIDPEKNPKEYTLDAAIVIDGDANFAATALLEGWPGDGSPENPFIIDGLDILVGGGYIISISNTQASFTISNCNLTGWCYNTRYNGAGIYLENVTNGEIVNNICSRHSHGIILYGSSSNTVFNNTCTDNIEGGGITLDNSDSNTVANNTCSNYGGICLFESDHNLVENNTVSGTWVGISLGHSDYNTISYNNCSSIMCGEATGIFLGESDSNTVSNNICNYNGHGISLESSDSNTVSNNICNHNEFDGIYLYDSGSNTVVNNTCNGNTFGIYIGGTCGWPNIMVDNICLDNTENDISDESLSEVLLSTMFVGFLGFIGITIVGGLIVGNRVSKGE
ncbi:MAG: nitrous oxide reductase family maturation protein NosD [Candidatus Sifarchaeia archaeon]